jgi:hypothetical protein
MKTALIETGLKIMHEVIKIVYGRPFLVALG